MKNELDVYWNEDTGWLPGENGDYTGSPYGYFTIQGDFVTLSTPENTPPIATASVQPVTVTQPSVEKQPWYDTVSQIADDTAKIITALNASKTNNTNNTGVVAVNANNDNKTDPKDSNKKWLWIVLIIVVILVLLFFIFRKKEK